MVYIIIKGKRPAREKHYILRTPAQAARHQISRENRQEYDNEKRARELMNRMPDGHIDARAVAVAKMMCIDEHKAKKLVRKKSKGVVLDGNID